MTNKNNHFPLLAIAVIASLSLLVFLADSQASSAAIVDGRTITISYTVDGSPPFTQQWRKGGVAISGATAPTLVILSASSDDAGVYTVEVSNSAGSTTSDSATLFLAPDASIRSWPILIH